MTSVIPKTLQPYFSQLQLPDATSHKGQNGKLLIIGGSELFHAASRWSLDIASKFVDMVFYASVPSTAELVRTAKGEFWNGIVIELSELSEYLDEADAVLIGPGMTRSVETRQLIEPLIVNHPTKRWVIDAGALQMMDWRWLTPTMIITPHSKELQRLVGQPQLTVETLANFPEWSSLLKTGVTVLLKGPTDHLFQSNLHLEIPGGNGGMTKGGTGDVLAGLVAALYTQHQAVTAAAVGSFVNKAAGDDLFNQVGPFFNASDLVVQTPKTLWRLLTSAEQ